MLQTAGSKMLAPPSPLQDRGVSARHNQFGTFQVKIDQKTETRTKTQNTKTIKTFQKTTVGDEIPTAGRRLSTSAPSPSSASPRRAGSRCPSPILAACCTCTPCNFCLSSVSR